LDRRRGREAAEPSGHIEDAFGIGHERSEAIFDRWAAPGQMAVETGETERESGGVEKSTSLYSHKLLIIKVLSIYAHLREI